MAGEREEDRRREEGAPRARVRGARGKVFWSKVVAAHAAEGTAAHLTSATPAGQGAGDQRSAMLAAHEAIREYVSHVVGTVRRKKPATQTLADELLRPLAEWPVHATHAAETPPPPPPAAS